jgi:hypothetical protein
VTLQILTPTTETDEQDAPVPDKPKSKWPLNEFTRESAWKRIGYFPDAPAVLRFQEDAGGKEKQ